jgi:hypothetical protein
VQEPGDAERTRRVPEEGVSESPVLDADRALSVYLNDHLAGSAAGVQLAKRCREAHGDSDLGRYLEGLVGQIEEDRRVLERVMTRVGAQSNLVKQAGALGAEVLARLKHLTPVLGAGSTVARLEEIELLSLGIEGKRLLWGSSTSCLAPMIGCGSLTSQRSGRARGHSGTVSSRSASRWAWPRVAGPRWRSQRARAPGQSGR